MPAHIQNRFNEGSALLAADDDNTCVANDDPMVYPPPGQPGHDPNLFSEVIYRQDDVSTYIDFRINPGPLDGSGFPTFPSSYHGQGYFDVIDPMNRDNLFDLEDGNIKFVNSLAGDVGGKAWARYTKPMTCVSIKDVPGYVFMHEFGHACGLIHRGEEYPPGSGHIPNPGTDSPAIMHGDETPPHYKVNHFERNLMLNY